MTRFLTAITFLWACVSALDAQGLPPSSQRFFAPSAATPVPPPHETIDPDLTNLFYFDRVAGTVWNAANPASPVDDSIKKAIAGSSTLLSGTVVKRTGIEGCWTYDWSTTVLAKESSNVIIYRPGDASIFCDPQPPPDSTAPPVPEPGGGFLCRPPRDGHLGGVQRFSGRPE